MALHRNVLRVEYIWDRCLNLPSAWVSGASKLLPLPLVRACGVHKQVRKVFVLERNKGPETNTAGRYSYHWRNKVCLTAATCQ